jgi:hypothetical protein
MDADPFADAVRCAVCKAPIRLEILTNIEGWSEMWVDVRNMHWHWNPNPGPLMESHRA